MMPNLEAAAIKAAETLIEYRISAAPVEPIHILKSTPNVVVTTFAEMALEAGMERNNLLKIFSKESHDAMTYIREIRGKLRYFVVFNQRLPMFMIQRGLARELGHVLLGHDGSRPEDVRMEEANVFAYHLICPRAVVRAVQDSPIRMTTEVLGTMTGCYERCLAGMRKTPGVNVPAELNRQVKAQFADYLEDFIDFYSILSDSDESADADFGTFMDGYCE